MVYLSFGMSYIIEQRIVKTLYGRGYLMLTIGVIQLFYRDGKVLFDLKLLSVLSLTFIFHEMVKWKEREP